MALIDWNEDFSCGIESVDHEHQELIREINDLYGKIADNCDAKTIEFHLGEIHGLIESHFALEERLMQSARYPNYSSHKDHHDTLLDEIRDIMDSVHAAPDSDFGIALADRLNTWFSDHFRTHDRDLHRLA